MNFTLFLLILSTLHTPKGKESAAMAASQLEGVKSTHVRTIHKYVHWLPL